MGHAFGMNSKNYILLMEKNRNLMVVKYKLVSKLMIIVVVFIVIINLLSNLFFKLTTWSLEFEISMLTCNRCI